MSIVDKAADFIQNNLYSVNRARLHDMLEADVPHDAIASIINHTAQKKNHNISVTAAEIAGYDKIYRTVETAPIVLIDKKAFDASMEAVEGNTSKDSGTPDEMLTA